MEHPRPDTNRYRFYEVEILVKDLIKDYSSTIEEYIALLDGMREEFKDSAIVSTQVTAHLLLRSTEITGQYPGTSLQICRLTKQFIAKDVVRRVLSELKLAGGPGYFPEKACLKGTRVEELNKLRSWCFAGENKQGPQVKLVTAQAGVGKSALAHALALELKKARRLGAFYAFSKNQSPENLFPTIARSLADLDPNYASILTEAITSDSTLATASSLSRQFDELLRIPLEAVSRLGPLGSIVIIIDALDECPTDIREICKFLGDSVKSLPSNIRFLVTSRPSEAQSLLQYETVVQEFKLEHAENSEILAFVHHRLQQLRDIKKGLTVEAFEEIATNADGIFQYAAVVCTEILDARGESPSKVFLRLTRSKGGLNKLDSLYRDVISHGLGISISNNHSLSELEKLKNFRQIMGWVLFSLKPLTHQVLVDFGSVKPQLDSENEFEDADFVSACLQPLGALLHGTSNMSSIVLPYHSSFGDFLLRESRSGQFYIGTDIEHHCHLANLCLQLMNRDLHFNMAGLESSYLANKDVENLEAKIDQGISDGLTYACVCFAHHLKYSAATCETFGSLKMLEKILDQKFLFWIEVLALKQIMLEAEKACNILHNWLEVWNKVTNA